MVQCKAKSKRSGFRCKKHSLKGKLVCKIHGGGSTGPKTAKGIASIKQANTTNGNYTKEAISDRAAFRSMILGYKTYLREASA